MNIREFKVFTWDRILIYLGICFAFPLTVFTQAIRYNYFEHHNGLPVGAWAAMIGALGGFSLGVFMLFWDRYQFKKGIEGYTTDGLMVMKPTYTNDLPVFEQMATDLEAATKEVVDFWEIRYPKWGNNMLDNINGACLGFTSQVIDLLAHPDFPTTNLPSTFKRFAVGITQLDSMLVMAQPTEAWSAVLPRIKHELGHIVLSAAYVPPDDQHPIMAKEGFPY
jgi:hypothetical protein